MCVWYDWNGKGVWWDTCMCVVKSGSGVHEGDRQGWVAIDQGTV